ncbi:hypothetical protein GGR58DRAFT_461235 [Xylaria digitata]|nr:hypothetical protein GGR58DRAFT_461235 [Xylaria digitata]
MLVYRAVTQRGALVEALGRRTSWPCVVLYKHRFHIPSSDYSLHKSIDLYTSCLKHYIASSNLDIMSSSSTLSGQSGPSRLESIIEAGSDIYEVYEFASEHGLINQLEYQTWVASGLASLDQILDDTLEYALQGCFMSITRRDHSTTIFAIKLAARQISRQEEELRSPTHYTVLYAEDKPSKEDAESWHRLVEDVAKSLCPLTKNATKVDADASADRCLEAIEAVTEITSPSQPTQHYFFIAGLDRAYGPTLGVDPENPEDSETETMGSRDERHEQYQLTEEDRERRGKVKRMVDALIRLFHGKGKLVFVVGPEFLDVEVVTTHFFPLYIL